MLTWFTPVILMCIFSPTEIHHCDEHTGRTYQLSPIMSIKVMENLPIIEVPITTPIMCMIAGTQYAAEELSRIKENNPDKDIEFRVICKHEKV